MALPTTSCVPRASLPGPTPPLTPGPRPQINSPFGRYDGNVYESYYNQVKAANPHNPVAPYFERVIRPLIEREPLELGDDADSMELDDEIAEIQAEREEDRAEADKADEAEKELKKPAEE